MEELRDSVIVVSIENALKRNQEEMNFTIDLPCKLSFVRAFSRWAFTELDAFF